MTHNICNLFSSAITIVKIYSLWEKNFLVVE